MSLLPFDNACTDKKYTVKTALHMIELIPGNGII